MEARETVKLGESFLAGLYERAMMRKPEEIHIDSQVSLQQIYEQKDSRPQCQPAPESVNVTD